ncbi:MAG TPA: HD domain-containing phosphohydrolase [Solirubrobacteraceae bacterium]|jgi:putative two-component system response regulator
MSDGPLRGTTVLLAGGERAAAEALREQLAAAGAAHVAFAADAAGAAAVVASTPPDAVVVLAGGEALRRRLDPLGLGLGTPLIGAEELLDDAAGRLAHALERHALRARVRELEAVVASQAVAGRREVDVHDRGAVRRLALAADYRDDNTHEHTERVAHLAALLGRALGLAPRTLSLIRAAAPLHDLGKIAIPDAILLKPERLSEEEYEVVKTHAAVGARILSGGGSELLETAERIARSHHERWDGTGYPGGLAGDEIPLVGRLVAVADVFDILVHERPYKEKWTLEDAALEIRRAAGTQLDPEVVAAFEALGPRAWTSSPHGAVF